MRQKARPSSKKVTMIEGSLDLREAQITVLVDIKHCWPVPTVIDKHNKLLINVIYLDGLTYKRFGTGSSDSVSDRKEWLMRQPPDDLGNQFKSQPFEELIKVYRDMGRITDANKISIFKRDKQHHTLSKFSKLWHSFLWIFVGYGYKPHRAIVFWIIIWMISSIFFYVAGIHGVMVPTNASILLNPSLESCSVNWTVCDKPAMTYGYPRFYPLIYAADKLLPIVDLGQGTSWSPIVKSFNIMLLSGEELHVCELATLIVMWFDIMFGWIVGLLLTLIVTGVVKRD